jgi:prepilin-type processing-associated H-X9-DG protein
LIVTVAVVAFLILLIAPGSRLAAAQKRRITCADQLRRISRGVAACFAENDGFGPTYDDGAYTRWMFTWTDLLFDTGYISFPRQVLCPSDARPDVPAEARGEAWGFRFVDVFGVQEPIKYGVRTSYALNIHMSRNFAEDRFDDASRQVYAIDGWWSFVGNLNAAWVYYEHVTGDPPPDPVNWPHWEATIAAWRHGVELSANALYLDGHVAPITPIVPEDMDQLLEGTVDTMASFTWLPGELNLRFDFHPYRGQVEEYAGRRPYALDPDPGTFKDVAGATMPIDYPEYLSCSWRTVNRAWAKLPSAPRDRR